MGYKAKDTAISINARDKKSALSWMFILLLAMLWLAARPSFASTNNPLPAEQAFGFSVSINSPDKLAIHWQIAKGYYLYRQKLHIAFDPKLIADIHLPQGQLKQDVNRGQFEIFSGSVAVPIVLHTQTQKIQLSVDYQGCSDRGFCYPPMHQLMMLDMATQSATVMSDVHGALPSQPYFQSLLTDQNGVRALLDSQRMGVMLLLFAGLGLLLAFTPCVLPMIPILTGIIVGHKQPVTTKKAFLLSSTYVLGSSITYAAAGVMAASMGGSLQVWLQKPWIIIMASALFVLLSLSLFGVYDLRLPNRWQSRITSVSRKQQGGTYVGVFIMGMVSTLIVSPCVTAPLVGVLMYIAESGNIVLGASALFVMGIGMGIPLILIGVSAGKWLPKRGRWMIGVQRLFGVFMLIMAVWLLARVYPLPFVIIFYVVVLLIAAMFYLFYQDKSKGSRSFLLLASMAGVLLISLICTPLIKHSLIDVYQPSSLASNSFTVVHSMDDLKKQLAIAQASGKPVILDFYADWCESCVAMDKKVFSTPDVLNSLNKFVLLRADLSQNNAADEDLLKNYDVIAPPTVLLFNDQGQEVNSHRIVGELTAQEFMTRINTFITASCDKKVAC